MAEQKVPNAGTWRRQRQKTETDKVNNLHKREETEENGSGKENQRKRVQMKEAFGERPRNVLK